MSLISLDQAEYKRLEAKAYSLEKRRLQIELLKLQEDVIRNDRKICIVFEGRDTAGKSSAIKFFSEYLRPKNFNYVQLGIPTKWESELINSGTELTKFYFSLSKDQQERRMNARKIPN